MIKVDIWSDFVCPFCYIGKRQLDLAAEKLGLKDELQVNYHSFELHPESPTKRGTLFIDALLNRYPDEAYIRTNVMAPMAAAAEAEGLVMKFDNLEVQNTLDAHRLAKYAKFYSKEEEFFAKGYEYIFKDNKFLADPEVLVELATEVGLDGDQARAVIEDKEKFKVLVEEDIAKARNMGIDGVPFFVFNDKFTLGGAVGVDKFVQALEKANEDGGLVDLSADANLCGPDGC